MYDNQFIGLFLITGVGHSWWPAYIYPNQSPLCAAAKHNTVMLGIRGEFWSAYIDLLVTAGFRYPRDHSQCIHRYVLSAVFSFRADQCYGTVRWEGSQRVSKALIQAKALGIHHHRGILTTIRSSFSEDDTYTSSSSPCHFFGCSETQGFCLIHNSWFITVFL